VKHLGDLLFPFVVTLVSRSIPFDPHQQEAEAKLWEEEERQQVERRARKEARAAEKKR